MSSVTVTCSPRSVQGMASERSRCCAGCGVRPRFGRPPTSGLQALTCDRFLPVVTGFPPSSREARAEVEEMLDRFSPGESDDDQDRSGE